MIGNQNSIKGFLRKNDALYVLVKSIKNLNNPDFCSLLRSYFIESYEGSVYFLEHPGTALPEKTIYDISVGESRKILRGFCAEMHHILYKLMFADEHALMPRIVWGRGSPYYEAGYNYTNNNAFEYYFEPVSEASKYSCCELKNLIRSDVKHILKYQNMVNGSYSPNDDNIRLLAQSFKKHIRLNEQTQRLISDGINCVCNSNNRILGIHARGGDFKRGAKNHPYCVAAEKYLDAAKQEFATGNYDKVFIATDDKNILEVFLGYFGNNLTFYDDVPRVSGKNGLHLTRSSRPLHHYKLGLEILRDVYTLTSCDSFICGLSHVSFMVQYVKESEGKKFDKVIVLNEGINQ